MFGTTSASCALVRPGPMAAKRCKAKAPRSHGNLDDVVLWDDELLLDHDGEAPRKQRVFFFVVLQNPDACQSVTLWQSLQQRLHFGVRRKERHGLLDY